MDEIDYDKEIIAIENSEIGEKFGAGGFSLSYCMDDGSEAAAIFL